MTFTSLQFLAFFPVVVSLYFLLPHKWRWLWLLGASCFFYMAFVPVYILILAFTIGVDYIAGIKIEDSQGSARRRFLVASIIANVGVLAFFKYYGFLTDNLETIVHGFGFPDYHVPRLGIILPIGLSFHTFQSLSYTVEVYRGKQKAERRLGIFALYVMYFPQLVAGPIERAANLLHQFDRPATVDYGRITNGLKLMAWGFFKKLMIADRVAVAVNHVYNDPHRFHGMEFILATVLFALQIYCDFSGYTDIARGASRVLGIELMLNFRSPYFSTSISEFWRRWHISLSSWFRDYVYIPLGGNKVVKWRWYYNLFITFFLSGLWHGANWTYVMWGSVHGFYLIFAILTAKPRARLGHALGLNKVPRLNHMLQMVTTFVLVCFAWIFFRANSIGDAFYIIRNMGSGFGRFFTSDARSLYSAALGIGYSDMLLALFGVVVMLFVDAMHTQGSITVRLSHRPVWQRWAVYYGLVGCVVFLGAYYSSTAFIYFQF